MLLTLTHYPLIKMVIKMKKYLFDESFIKSRKNTELKFENVHKANTSLFWYNPFSRPENCDIPDWERYVTIMYPFVVFDENGISVDGKNKAKYKLWFFSKAAKDWVDNIIDKNNTNNIDLSDFKNTAKGVIRELDSALCYLESNDGINWVRPSCNEFFYKKKNGEIVGTNIVFIGEHGMGVHKNLNENEPRFLFACAMDGVGVNYSEDGIHWHTPTRILSRLDNEFTRLPGDTHNQIFWSPELSRYVVITRAFIGEVRQVITLESTDVVKTIKDIEILETLGAELKGVSKCFTKPKIALEGKLELQPYSMPITRLTENCYIGVVSVANFDSSNQDNMKVYASLAYSNDGVNWNYLNDAKPFINNSKEFKLLQGNDYGMIFCAAPVITDDEVKIFYSATPELHYFSYDQIPEKIKNLVDQQFPKAKEAQAITRTTAMNVATFKKDRFAGLFSENGAIRTDVFKFNDEISLNYELFENGEISVAIFDENEKEIEGFSHNDFVSLKDNKPCWYSPISILKGQKISLEIKLNNATVYCIEY